SNGKTQCSEANGQWAGYRESNLNSGRGRTFFLTSLFIELIDSARPQPVVLHRQPENSRVAAVLLMPEVTVSGVFPVRELFFSSEGRQSGVLVPSVVSPKASMV